MACIPTTAKKAQACSPTAVALFTLYGTDATRCWGLGGIVQGLCPTPLPHHECASLAYPPTSYPRRLPGKHVSRNTQYSVIISLHVLPHKRRPAALPPPTSGLAAPPPGLAPAPPLPAATPPPPAAPPAAADGAALGRGRVIGTYPAAGSSYPAPPPPPPPPKPWPASEPYDDGPPEAPVPVPAPPPAAARLRRAALGSLRPLGAVVGAAEGVGSSGRPASSRACWARRA